MTSILGFGFAWDLVFLGFGISAIAVDSARARRLEEISLPAGMAGRESGRGPGAAAFPKSVLALREVRRSSRGQD